MAPDVTMSLRLHQFPVLTYAIGAHIYSYDGGGAGVSLDGYKYDESPFTDTAELEVILSDPDPVRLKPGYWRTQCFFRGIMPATAIGDNYELLFDHIEDPIPHEITQRANEIIKEYFEKKQKFKEQLWKECKNDSERMQIDPVAVLDRLFSNRDSFEGWKEDDPILLDHDQYCFGIKCAAKKLNLSYIQGERYQFERGQLSFKRYEIVGTNWDKVWAVHRAWAVEHSNLIAQQRRVWDEEAEEEHDAIVEREGQKTADAEWDVTGTWYLSCTGLDAKCDMPQKLRMEIFLSGSGDSRQLYATLQLGKVLYGCWRFENPNNVEQPRPNSAQSGNKRTRALSNENTQCKRRKNDDGNSKFNTNCDVDHGSSDETSDGDKSEEYEFARRCFLDLGMVSEAAGRDESEDDQSSLRRPLDLGTVPENDGRDEWEVYQTSLRWLKDGGLKPASDDGEESEDIDGAPRRWDEKFILRATDKPSPSISKWAFQWVTSNMAKRDQLYPELYRNFITFGGPGGSEFSAMLEIHLVSGGCRITGIKTANAAPDAVVPDVQDLWSCLGDGNPYRYPSRA